MFKEEIFNNFIRLNRGFDLPDALIEEGIFPVVASTSIKANHKHYRVKGPGVVTGRSGSLGTVQYIKSDYWPLNTSLYVKDFKGNYPKFVYYFLQLMHLENFNSGAGVPSLNQNHLHKLKINIPHLNEQKKIAAILSAYDDLIENHQRRIVLLEKMAEEIYREWFVRLRFPGHENVKVIKGVPEGWKIERLVKIFDYLEGPGIRNWQYTESGVPFMNIRLISDGDIKIENANFVSENEAYGKYSHFLLKDKDFVVSTSGTLGRGAIVQSSHLPLMLNTSVIRFRPIQENHLAFMYGYLKSDNFLNQVEMYASGSAQQNFGPAHLKLINIIKPSDDILLKFNEFVMPQVNSILLLRNIIKNLKLTRDMLLPRLISGKLNVERLDIQFPPSMLAEAEPSNHASEAH